MKMKVSEIKPNPNNPRLIKDDKFKKLVASLKDFPIMAKKLRKVVVDEGNVILGGNMRFKAIKEAGMKEVHVEYFTREDAEENNRLARTLDAEYQDRTYEEQCREFVIKDNVSGGEWDWDILANEWDAEELDAWGLDTPDDWGEDKEVEEDEAPEVDESEPPKSKLGETYQLGRHRVMCGDSTSKDDVNKLLGNTQVDMTFTDPPYNALMSWKKDEAKSETRLNPNNWFANDNMSWEEFDTFLEKSFANMRGHSTYICCDYRIYPIVRKHLVPTEYDEKHCIVWRKNQFGLGKRYRFQHEFVSYAAKEKAPFYGGHSQGDVWDVDVDRSRDHNTPKPVELPARAIKNSSEDNGVVLDLFLGSGTTLIAAEQTNRTCVGMELAPRYVDVIRKRYHKFVTGSEEGWEENTPAIKE